MKYPRPSSLSTVLRSPVKKSPALPQAQLPVGKADLLKRTLHGLFVEVQESFMGLAATVEEIAETGERKTALKDLDVVKKKLKDRLARVSENMSLLGTVLETESSEILHYVKKRAG